MEKRLNNYPKSLRVIRWWFPKIEKLSIRLAGAIARKLFFTPLRYPYPKSEKKILGTAKKFAFESKKRLLLGYEWGEGPVVILLHGWSGRGTQLWPFVEPLVKQGYKVVTADAPGHGKSTGNYADLVQFSEMLVTLVSRYDEVKTVIAHSLGGAATLYAVKNGLSIGSAVVIGTPSIATEIISNFVFLVNGSKQTGSYITDHIEKTYGKPFSYYSAQETGKDVYIPTLIIHDEEDLEVRSVHAGRLSEVLDDTLLYLTKGLGHTRILRDEGVVQETVSFVNESVHNEIRKVG